MSRALFLDRDGIINVDKGYLYKIEDIEFIDGIFDLCKMASDKDYQIVVITNQAGIARGLYSHEDVEILHKWIKNQFSHKNINISAIYYCPHHPDFSGVCDCRKPAPGMVNAAVKELGIDVAMSFMVGDKVSDVQSGKNAGVGHCVLVNSKYVDEKPVEADVMVSSVREAYEYLRERM